VIRTRASLLFRRPRLVSGDSAART